MPADSNDMFRAWTDLTLAGFRTYSSMMLAGLDMASRVRPPVPSFPAPAILRNRPTEIWPAAGSFGSGTNAVAAWAEAASSMMGVSPARAPSWAGMGFNPFAWMMPQLVQPMTPPWLAGMMSPAAFAPMAMWGRPFGLAGAMPGFGWPMPAFGMPFAPPFGGMSDPFRMFGMMMPMLEAFAPKPQRSSRYH
jgi:hypothetical protein